jgi:ADP-ribose pyrophosphatase
MIEDPKAGVLVGKGNYYHWGPNYTVDSIILHNGKVLLVQRGDNGMWALPAGFIDPGEDVITAGIRETIEETGVDLRAANMPTLIFQGPIVDARMTANAWPETSCLVFALPHDVPQPEVKGMDDADDAKWVRIEDAEQTLLFGGHNFLLNKALEPYRSFA